MMDLKCPRTLDAFVCNIQDLYRQEALNNWLESVSCDVDSAQLQGKVIKNNAEVDHVLAINVDKKILCNFAERYEVKSSQEN